jgi:hypothetical protein
MFSQSIWNNLLLFCCILQAGLGKESRGVRGFRRVVLFSFAEITIIYNKFTGRCDVFAEKQFLLWQKLLVLHSDEVNVSLSIIVRLSLTNWLCFIPNYHFMIMIECLYFGRKWAKCRRVIFSLIDENRYRLSRNGNPNFFCIPCLVASETLISRIMKEWRQFIL